MIPQYLNISMSSKHVKIIEVFVYDFIGATKIAELTHLLHISRCMLHGIHAIFPPSEITQHGGGDSVSENNRNKEDGTWEYEK